MAKPVTITAQKAVNSNIYATIHSRIAPLTDRIITLITGLRWVLAHPEIFIIITYIFVAVVMLAGQYQ